MIKRIATVAVYVEDQRRAVEFWTDQVGFEVRADRAMGPNASWIEVAPAGAQTCLVLYPRSEWKEWAEFKPAIVFECVDIHATFERMVNAGVTFVQPPKSMPWGKFARFVDLDGNEFMLKE